MQANALPENEGILEDPWSSPVNGVPPHRRASELCAVRLSPDTFEGPAISHRERGEQAKAAHNRRLRIMQSVFSLASRCRVGGWQEVAARDGELKTDWTEPRPERRSMGIEWRPSGSRRRRCLQGRPCPGRPSGTPDDGAGCTGFGGIGAGIGTVRQGSAARAGSSPPVAGSRQAYPHGDDGATAGRRHEVSWMAGRGAPGCRTATWIMRPWRQTGHSHRDMPVSSSQRSR
jgi:hypothetical protein